MKTAIAVRRRVVESWEMEPLWSGELPVMAPESYNPPLVHEGVFYVVVDSRIGLGHGEAEQLLIVQEIPKDEEGE